MPFCFPLSNVTSTRGRRTILSAISTHFLCADRAYRCGVCREMYSMPPRMMHGRLHVMGSLKALAMTTLIALLALGVSGARAV